MKSNIIFLDDTPSLLDEEIADHFVNNIKKLSKTLIALKKIRPCIQMHMNTNFFQLKISDTIVLQNIPNQLKSLVKEELLSFKTNLQKNPYSFENDDKLERYWGIQVLYNNENYESLIWSYLLDSIVISFEKNRLNWNSADINALLLDLNNDEEDIFQENLNIRHANIPEHVIIHNSWISKFETQPVLDEFLKDPAKFLSQIILLDEAKDNIRGLGTFYPSIFETLSIVNNDLVKWDQKSEINFSVKNATGEHQKRKKILADAGLEGYEAHFFFTGIAGRIHYKLNGKILEIKYVGKKIGT